jgi:PAS domain-containing protein
MSASPDFSENQSDQTAWCSAIPDAENHGESHNESADVKVRRTERSRTSPNTPAGYLREMPALTMLDGLAIPMLAVRLDGVVFYNNPAFAAMLGHEPDTVALIGQRLPELMAGHSATPPRDCVNALRFAGTVVVDWLHAEGFPVRSVISETAFVRGTEQILLIGVTDVNDLMWTTSPNAR